MYKFTKQLKAVLAKYTALRLKRKAERKLLKLLNFRTIKARVFYDILNTRDYSLLNPKGISVDESTLDLAWMRILEQFYRETDESKYIEFINNIKRSNAKRNEMIVIEMAWMLSMLGDENAVNILKEKGIANINKLNQVRTKYKMYLAKEKQKQSSGDKKADFYRMMADIMVSEKIQINPDLLLIEWVGIISAVRRSNDIKKAQLDKNRK